jgi:hypothetical protein
MTMSRNGLCRPRPADVLHFATLIVLVLSAGSARAAAPADTVSEVTQNVPPSSISNPPTTATDTETGTDTSNWSGSADLTFASRYLFQGIDYSNGKPVFQPDVTLGYGNFSVSAWGNYDMDWQRFNEFDFTFSYAATYRMLSISAGYVNLIYPNREDWDPSQEFFLDASLEAPLSPSLSCHYDFDAGKGTYASLGISEPIRWNTTLGAILYYQNAYYGMTGIPALELNAGFSFPIRSFNCTPAISRLVTWENGDFRNGAGPRDAWLFSLSVSRDF